MCYVFGVLGHWTYRQTYDGYSVYVWIGRVNGALLKTRLKARGGGGGLGGEDAEMPGQPYPVFHCHRAEKRQRARNAPADATGSDHVL